MKSISLRKRLLLWILLPLLFFLIIDTIDLYKTTLKSVNNAYDRSLLTAARTISEQISLQNGRLIVNAPLPAFESIDINEPGRIYYRVLGFAGEHISGYEDFPPFKVDTPRSKEYPALIHFYDDEFRGEKIRSAGLYQPIVSPDESGIALIQVAETQESRHRLTHSVLTDVAIRQGSLIIFVCIIVWLVVTLSLKPLYHFQEQVFNRAPDDLSEIATHQMPKELSPLANALNNYVVRFSKLLESRQRFIADASHQLRTPLSVLKTQMQIVQRTRDSSTLHELFASIEQTIEHAIRLANQLLSLARAEHRQAHMHAESINLSELCKEICVELAPHAIEKKIDLSVDLLDCHIAGDRTLLHELVSNLVHNALRYTPKNGAVNIKTSQSGQTVVIEISDNGPGIPSDRIENVFQRFNASNSSTIGGVGLGLAIAKEICLAHKADIQLENKTNSPGLVVRITFPT